MLTGGMSSVELQGEDSEFEFNLLDRCVYIYILSAVDVVTYRVIFYIFVLPRLHVCNSVIFSVIAVGIVFPILYLWVL